MLNILSVTGATAIAISAQPTSSIAPAVVPVSKVLLRQLA